MEEEDIHLLITRFLLKQTSTEENAVLADWITASSENEQTFEAIKVCWLPDNDVDNKHAILELSKLNAIIDEQERHSSKSKPRLFHTWALAALLLLVGSITTTLFVFQKSPIASAAYLQQVSKAGEIKTFKLNDGTKITLGPGSSLKYPALFDEQQRDVELIGEAYFEVSKNAHKPFRVRTRELDVKVLGTHFNVNASKNGHSTAVSLFEGKVNVNVLDDHNEEYHLKPGQQLTLDHSSQQIYQHALDSLDVLGWMTKTLIFSNEKLSDAAKKIEKMYGVKLVFDNVSTGEARIHARFTDQSLDDVLQTICLTGDLQYTNNDNKIYISNKT